jgi:addiction module HigA family antidote
MDTSKNLFGNAVIAMSEAKKQSRKYFTSTSGSPGTLWVLAMTCWIKIFRSVHMLARRIGVTPRRINEIVLGKRSITADTAIRLAYYFGTSEEFWMGLQNDYELEEAHRNLKRKLKDFIQPLREGH